MGHQAARDKTEREAAMAELRRQGSRESFMLDLLTTELGLSASVAEGYVPGLVEEGYDTEEIFLGLSTEELRDDFGWRKGHVKRFETFREQRAGDTSRRYRRRAAGRRSTVTCMQRACEFFVVQKHVRAQVQRHQHKYTIRLPQDLLADQFQQ